MSFHPEYPQQTHEKHHPHSYRLRLKSQLLSLPDRQGPAPFHGSIVGVAFTHRTHNEVHPLIAVSWVGPLKRAERLPSRVRTFAIFSPSVMASSTIILAPHVHTSGSTPTVYRNNSAHGIQNSASVRPVEGLPAGGGPD